MSIIDRLRVRGNSDIADGYEDKTERGQFDLEVVAELVRLSQENDDRVAELKRVYELVHHWADEAKRLQGEVDALLTAANTVLSHFMPSFPDSRAVDDCLVGLAAAVVDAEAPGSAQQAPAAEKSDRPERSNDSIEPTTKENNLNKSELLTRLGKPDRILLRGQGMVSRAWFCSNCAKVHTFTQPVRVPAPCECGGIAFEKRS
jgi:hypothetical protein